MYTSVAFNYELCVNLQPGCDLLLAKMEVYMDVCTIIGTMMHPL